MKSLSSSKALAFIFILLTLGLLTWSLVNIKSIEGHIDNNVFSLLPKSERNIIAEKFVNRVSSQGDKTLVVLIGSDNIATALEAEKVFRSLIQGLELKKQSTEDNFSAYISLLKSHRSGLVTPEDISLLNQESSKFWFEKSSMIAYSIGAQVIPWKDDPFGLLTNWLYRLGKNIKIYPYADSLVVDHDGISYVVIPLEAKSSLESIQAQNDLADGLNSAIAETTNQFHGVQFLRSGVVFIASDTARVTKNDISTIGLISAITALILIAAIFRSFYAIFVVLLTVSIGFLYAFLMCLLIFPKVYILTLAFGTSLIGMSVDYCLYWLTASIDDDRCPIEKSRYLWPGMFLALITTGMGYCLLAITPFPVLSQMAVFSIGGITSSWLTVLLVFPHIKKLRFTSNRTYSLLNYIQPGFFRTLPAMRKIVIGLSILLSIYGVLVFKVNDDIRSLASFNKELIKEQSLVSIILDIPSPSQFFIVTGSTESDVLDQAESLSWSLDQLVSAGYISGYKSISQYVPSRNSQNRASQAYASINKKIALEKISKEMEMEDKWMGSVNQITSPLTIADLSSLTIYKNLSYLWFDSEGPTMSTAILLMGVRGQPSVDQLSKLVSPNVVWIDKPQEISGIFKRYRTLFSYIVLTGYLLTFFAIYIKYKEEAWRAVLPPIFATLITLGILTLMGETIGLLSVIAFALLLGVGTDYGIFLLQYPGDRKVLFSISIAALMTLISFGSLSLSSVPALHSFGIALFFGVSLSWLLTIFFAKDTDVHG
jgi:predicted exporter